MNYIKRLQAENDALTKRLADAEAELEAFRVHLHGEKFTGTESDGGRKDWIATGDVLVRLGHIKDELKGAA